MSKLSVNLCGIDFKNPIITASGTFGFGREYDELFDISVLGGMCTKGMTINPKAGNPSPRIAETYGGILNAVGLQNPGVEHFLATDDKWLATKDIVVIANIAGGSIEDYIAIAEKINE
ncbi:MAG: dihydroorotate dehydrogenase, partial [Clostridia bacterium]